MSEAEEILKAMWDYDQGEFLAKDSEYPACCFFCKSDTGTDGRVATHDPDCPMIALNAYATAQGWTKK